MIDLAEIGFEFNAYSGADPKLEDCLKRTLLEVVEAIESGNASDQIIEIADIILTLASGCAAAGLDLNTAVKVKHSINMGRKWEPHPDIPGTVRRIK